MPLFSSPADRDEGARRGAAAARRHRRRDRRAASFRRRRTMSIAARRAASRRCAGRTTSATSEPRAAVRRRRGRLAVVRSRARSVRLSRTLVTDPPTCGARATPSIRRRTSCSKRRPAPARRACSSSATSTCCAPASSPITSSRSRSRARPPPRCASASSSGCGKRAGSREFDAGALARPEGAPRRHRHLDDRRLLPVAAARVSARGRRRSRLRPRRRHRGAAARRRVARSGAAHLPRPSRATTTTWRWCSRSWASGGCAAGIAALLDRRLVAPQALRRFLQSGPRDLTAATACAAAAARLRDVFGGVARRPRRVPGRRPGPPSAVRDAGGRHAQLCCVRDGREPGRASRIARRAGGVPRARSIGCAPTS